MTACHLLMLPPSRLLPRSQNISRLVPLRSYVDYVSVTTTTSVTNNARLVTKEMGERTILGGDALNLTI
jgi:hypothetical protein